MPGKTNYQTAYPVGARVEIKPESTKTWCGGVVVSNPPLTIRIDDGHPVWNGAELSGYANRLRKMK